MITLAEIIKPIFAEYGWMYCLTEKGYFNNIHIPPPPLRVAVYDRHLNMPEKIWVASIFDTQVQFHILEVAFNCKDRKLWSVVLDSANPNFLDVLKTQMAIAVQKCELSL